MPVWNATNITEVSNLLSEVNTASNGIFGLMFLIAIYAIGYIFLSSRTQSHDAFLVTTVFGAIMSILLHALGAIDAILVIPTMLLVLIAVGINLIGGKR